MYKILRNYPCKIKIVQKLQGNVKYPVLFGLRCFASISADDYGIYFLNGQLMAYNCCI